MRTSNFQGCKTWNGAHKIHGSFEILDWNQIHHPNYERTGETKQKKNQVMIMQSLLWSVEFAGAILFGRQESKKVATAKNLKQQRISIRNYT